MSWSVSGQSDPNEAKRAVREDAHTPQDVKAAFELVIDALPHTHNVAWSTHGHIGDDHGNIRIDVQTVAHMPEPKPA